MRMLTKKILALMLCVCMLFPALASAENDAQGAAFSLTFRMDASAWPGRQEIIRGIADLLNIVTVSGSIDMAYTGCFDLNADVMLDGADETRTAVRLYGLDSHWGIESSLLGKETLMINLQALLEFAMKAYFHLDVPLQRVAMVVSPYVHQNAFEQLYSAWRDVMLAEEGTRTIAKDDLLLLAGQMAKIAQEDRALIYWVRALALEAGYDEAIFTFMEQLPQWVEQFVAEDGLTVTAEGGVETWQTGDMTLYTQTDSESGCSFSLNLPESIDGYALTASYLLADGEHHLNLVVLDEAEETLLHADVSASQLPESLPIAAPFAVDLDLTGDALGEGFRLVAEGSGEDGFFTVDLLNPDTRQSMLNMSGLFSPCAPATTPSFTPGTIPGVNLLSVNDTTLAELVHNVQEPLITGMLPLLLHVPASSFQSLLDLITESGVLGVLTSGSMGSEEEFGDEEFFEEEWDEEWDEEAFSEEEWDEEWDEEEFSEEEWDEEWDEEEFSEEEWDEEWDEEEFSEEEWDEEEFSEEE